MNKTRYSKEVTELINNELIYGELDRPPVDVELDKADVDLHKTLSIPVRALEYALLDLVLRSADLNRRILARNTKGREIPKLAIERDKYDKAIITTREAITKLNDSLAYKINLKNIEGS